MTSATTHAPIAIIGIGCNLPGAHGPAAFWQLLCAGHSAIRELPPGRFDIRHYLETAAGKLGRNISTRGGFIDAIDQFEPGVFGISPREADSMDPQQRLLLEVAWEALEDAGITRRSLQGNSAGVFIGMSSAEYGDLQLHMQDVANMDVYTLSGTARSILAGRISHAFDLRGPSVAVDTACSSSLVAVHLACQSIWHGGCDLALAGGVNVILTPEPWAALALARILSADGEARVFDAAANGFVRGEGAGVVVLKPLHQAQADGDPIYAVIRGCAINNDGRNSSVMTPNGQAQETVLRAAYRHAGIAPGAVHYVEAHGTGTSVGDPIEIRALGAVIAEGRAPDTPCIIGSVKTNIGHLEAAAGISGLIKAALCVKHRAIPPSLHFTTPNPAAPWDELPLEVARTLRPWPVADGPALAGVSSFGISGANVHVVLESAPAAAQAGDRAGDGAADGSAPAAPHLLPLSAPTPAGLAATVARWSDFLTGDGAAAALSDICYTAGVRRNHHAQRAAFVAHSHQELAEQLAAWQPGAAPTPVQPRGDGAGPVFVFSGQGAQFWPVDAALLPRFPVFRAALETCAALLRRHGADWDLIEQLTAPEGGSRLQETAVCQAAIFACQVALAAQWRAWGIQPSAVIGHSLGEVAAAHVAGVLTLEQALTLVLHRGRITAQAAGKGAMALVGLSAAETAAAIRDDAPALVVAVDNSATSCVLAGEPVALAAGLEQLQARNVFVRRLPAIDYAAHSPQMEPLRHELAAALAGLVPAEAAIPFYSTVTATPLPGADLHPGYWAANLRQPVRFGATLQRALADGQRVFLEVHPVQVLLRPMQEGLAQAGVEGAVYASLTRDAGPAALLRTLGQLYRHGYAVAWPDVFPAGGRHVTLPPLPWQKHRHWLPGADQADAGAPRRRWGGVGGHPLAGAVLPAAAQPGAYLAQSELACSEPRYLTDHRVHGAAVLPAAAYVEIGLAIATAITTADSQTDQTDRAVLTNLTLQKALVLPEAGAVEFQVAVTAGQDTLDLTYYSRPADAAHTTPWTLHAQGSVRLQGTAQPPVVEMAAFQAAADATIDRAAHYRMMTAHGLEYGPCFQGIDTLWRCGQAALARLELPEAVAAELPRYQIHPAVLDLAFQSVAALLPGGDAGGAVGAYLPVGLESLQNYASPQAAAFTYAVLRAAQPAAPQRLVADVYLLDAQGSVLAAAAGLTLQQLAGAAADPQRALYQITWQPQPLPEQSTPAQTAHWLILDAATGLGAAVAAHLRSTGGTVRVLAAGSGGAGDLDLSSRGAVAQFVATLAQTSPPLAGLVYLAGPASATSHTPVGEEALLGCLHLAQALVEHGECGSPRLWLVTRGAQPVTPGDPITLQHAALWGLARTVALEAPRLRCSIIDLPAQPDAAEGTWIGQEVLADGPENQVALRQEQRWCARLVRYAGEDAPALRPAAPDEPLRLATPAPGILDRLTLTAAERIPPAADQVEIRVHSAGLNFLDVLTALGLRPDQADGDAVLGMECAGTVTRAGSAVTAFRPGDAVLAVAPYSMGAYALTLADLVTHKPAGLSFQAAATLPIAYLTAYYALHVLGRIRQGERILIHAAAGGVGLAAVHLARRAGAEIFATAGSPEKRAYLRELGVAHVFDSRTLDFADAVLALTGGAGVDLVLNALAGAAIPRSLSLLRANGRFLEIGKRDIYAHSRLDMGLLKKNIAFFAIDLIPLLAAQPALCRELLAELTALIADGALPPLPYVEFPLAQAEQAFRYMAQAKHTGKIVLVAEPAPDAAPALIAPRPRGAVRRYGSYLVTGGLGGLGLRVAAWLVAKGARSLVLLGRNAPSPAAAQAIAALAAQGTDVVTVQADVAQETELRGVLDRIATTLPPLCGVFHAAGVLDDGLLLHMDAARLRRVLAPKADGAWLLHRLTEQMDLDLFMLFSSATAVLGAPGQANYAAANAFLDGLAHYRRARGLPALAIDWGAWAEVGMVARMHQPAQLTAQGILTLPPQFGLELLARCLAADATQITAMQVDWPRLVERLATPLLAEMAAAEATAAGARPGRAAGALATRLRSLPPTERAAAVYALLQQQLAQVLRTPVQPVAPQQPLSELGIDSLMTVELVNRIEAELAITIPVSTLLQSPTVADLTSLLVRLLEDDGQAAARSSPAVVNGAGDDGFARSVADLAREAVLDPALRFAPVAASRPAPARILLTGATGFVGAYLLRDLLATTRAEVVCLVRAGDAESGRARLLQTLADTFADTVIATERIVVAPGDLTQPQLGLSAAEFTHLGERIDLIVHSGAQINWLAPYARLKPANVLGTAAIIALAAHRGIPLHYVSTLAVFPFLADETARVIDERTPLDHGGVLHGGYTQSKWVAEKLVAAAQAQGLPVAIYRPGLVIGDSRTGVWRGENIVANMLRSWIALGMAPAIDAQFDLTPVDYVSRAMVELLTCGEAGGVYHLNNPRPVRAQEMIDWLTACGYPIRPMPYPAWRSELLRHSDGRRQVMLDGVGPLLALPVSADVAWLGQLPRIDNAATQQALGGLTCPPVDGRLLQNLVAQLQHRGYLPASQ